MSIEEETAPTLSGVADIADIADIAAAPDHPDANLASPIASPMPRAMPHTRPLRRKGWRRVANVALIAFGLLSLLLLGLSSGFVSSVFGAEPQTSGSVRVPGLHHPVAVTYDSNGAPYIIAQDRSDGLFAWGWITMQQRGFQVYELRALATGELAAFLGDDPTHFGIQSDTVMRSLDLARASQAEYARLSPDDRAWLDDYSSGVNAYMTTQDPPPEIGVLNLSGGYTIPAWRPWDSLTILRYLDYSLTDVLTPIAATRLTVRNPELTDALIPPYPADHPTVFGSPAGALSYAQAWAALDATTRDQLTAWASETTPPTMTAIAGRLTPTQAAVHSAKRGGSNAWVVDGAHSATGMPLIASDPHLSLAQAPTPMARITLRGGDLNISGVAIPGVPAVLIGQSGSGVSWAITLLESSPADWKLVNLSDARIATRTATIHVRGGDDITVSIKSISQPDGDGHALPAPILPFAPDLVGGFTPLMGKTVGLALQWAGTDGAASSYSGLFRIASARDWSSFNAALDHISVGLNEMYADDFGAHGDIGYRMAGTLPLRASANLMFPSLAFDKVSAWNGYVAPKDLPACSIRRLACSSPRTTGSCRNRRSRRSR